MFQLKLKSIMSLLLKATITVAAFMTLGFIAINAPQIHSDYIRNTVGSQVVEVRVGKGGGTGFHVKAPSGEVYILTNEHICNNSKNGIVDIRSGNKRLVPRRIIEMYSEHDLCLVEALPGYRGIKLSSKAARVGQIVGIVGHPRLDALTLARGEIIDSPVIPLVVGVNVEDSECMGETVKIEDPFMKLFFGVNTMCVRQFRTHQASYISYPGNSGSPVINFYGRLVGVHFAGRRDVVTDGYMVPLRYVEEFLRNY